MQTAGPLFALLAAAGFLAVLIRSPNDCVMSYSYPSYNQVVGVPDQHSHTYRLFSYVETHGPGVSSERTLPATKSEKLTTLAGQRVEPRTAGVPVVFVPGSSGSYKQVRSLASETAKQHAATPVGRILDWYALDFSEELSAFDGVLLARQHRFLAAALQHLDAMYTAAQTPNPPPVIVVGHSMGGVLACSVAQGLPDVVGAVLALAAPLANSPWMGQLSLAHMYVSLPNPAVMPVPVASVSGGFRDIQVPDWMTAAAGVSVSLPQVVGVSADHQCIVWCHQAVVHMARALRHLAASDGQTRGEAGVRHREEALHAWLYPTTKEQPSARRLAATAAPVVVASLLALPALCLMHVFVCAAAGARGSILPGITLVSCSCLRSLVTSAPPGQLLVVAALLVARLCGNILGDVLVDAVAWVHAHRCALLMAGTPVLGFWLLGAHLLITGARHSRLCAQLAVAYAWGAVCAAPAAWAWAQVVLAQGWPHRPRPSQPDVVLAMAAWILALRVVTQRDSHLILPPLAALCAACICAAGAAWALPVAMPIAAFAACASVKAAHRKAS